MTAFVPLFLRVYEFVWCSILYVYRYDWDVINVKKKRYIIELFGLGIS